MSRYLCPADCVHNPFAPANYTQLLSIEDALDKKTLAWLFSDTSDRAALALAFRRAVETESPHAAHAFTSWRLFVQQEADGLTCAQRWDRAGLAGLKNDERVLFRAKMQARVALLEIRCVVDTERIEVVDLFASDKGVLNVIDRSLARQGVRFAPFLTWAFPLPFFWRMAGTAMVIPDWAPFEPAEIVTELARHLGGPIELEPLRRWAAEHFVRVAEALDATARERRRRMFARMDAKWGSAVYELRAPFGECRAALDSVADVDRDGLDDKERREGFAEARIWSDAAGQSVAALLPGGRPVLGRVLLGQTFWRLEAMGGDRLGRLRGALEARLGRRVRFTGERLDDVGARLAMGEPPGAPALVPPRLLEHLPEFQIESSQLAVPPGADREEVIAEMEQARLREFPDQPVPALDGRTPREAARDLTLRPKLVRLMKSHVRGHDEKNLQTGGDADINGLLRDLGLDELDVPPPPPRPPVDTADPGEMDPRHDGNGFQGEADDTEAHWPEPDPLPEQPFAPDEAVPRLNIAMTEFDTAAEALNELEASGANLIPGVRELTADLLSETEFSGLVVFLLQAWFALVPPGCRSPRLRLPSMREELRKGMALVTPQLLSASMETVQGILADCRQPALLQELLARVADSGRKTPKNLRPSAGGRVAMVVVLKVLLNELDHALRHS